MHRYQMLMQKQRGASSIKFKLLPKDAINDIGTSAAFEDIAVPPHGGHDDGPIYGPPSDIDMDGNDGPRMPGVNINSLKPGKSLF